MKLTPNQLRQARWTVKDTPQGPAIVDGNGERVAEVYLESDAPLIAAAPALLAALCQLLARAETLDQSATHDGLANCDALAKARAAVTQAEARP